VQEEMQRIEQEIGGRLGATDGGGA
jgi:hypothetical protein